ncbi:hypothetical protein OK016_16395 [Vibrio chagasii]|nr:hypothetical protein [Vibrio chagasii]
MKAMKMLAKKLKNLWFNSGPAISKYLNIKDVDKSNELLEPILKKTLSTDTSVRQAVNFVNLVKDREGFGMKYHQIT